MASCFGHLEVVRTLLQGGVDVKAQDKVRNQTNAAADDDDYNNTVNYLDDDDADDDDYYRCIYVNNR